MSQMKQLKAKKLHMDNRGSAMLIVIIAMALIGILASILMFVAYAGYQMRLVDRQGKDSFYSAETVLDEINVGLQEEVSTALSMAYEDLMLNYGLYETPEKRSNELYKVYYDQLKTALALDAAHQNQYSIDRLRSYLSPEILGDGEGADGSYDKFGTYGAVVESNVEPEAYTLVLNEDGIVLKDLKVTYVDESGYVSIISTDIKIILPNVTFAQSSAFPNIHRYSFIAQSGFESKNTDLTVQGDVYAGKISLGVPGEGEVLTQGAVIFEPATGAAEDELLTLISKEEIEVGEKASLQTKKTQLWAKNIQVTGAKIDLEGDTYVKDDFTLLGNGSNLKIAGAYTGFGTDAGNADESSSIVVNGKNTSLDLSAVTSLILGGHSYISTAYQVTDTEATEEEKQNENNILMGESIAVKSHQLIYMVPRECLGCEIDAEGVVGESAYGSNPLTLEQYNEIFVTNPDKYVKIDGKKQVKQLGGKTLEDYIQLEDVEGSSEKQYVPEVVFKQTNAGTLVYCYLRFKDENAANQYFEDYYHVNAEMVDKYTKLYTTDIALGNEADMTYLYLAGNVLEYTQNAGSIQEATDSYAQKQAAKVLASTDADVFKALNAKLVTNIAQLNTVEQGQGVYENIIDKGVLLTTISTLGSGGVAQFESETANPMVTLLSNHNYSLDDSTPENVHLIVCSGNVEVKRDFKGVIIADGTILVEKNAGNHAIKLEALSVEEFSELMLSKRMVGEKDYYVLDVFKDGVNYAYSGNTSKDFGTREVDLADLIVYERWSKK